MINGKFDASDFQAPADVNRWRTLALGVGGIFTIIWAIGCFFNVEQGLRSWLLGFIFWGGIGIGSIGILLLQYLTGGAWGVVIRRFVEAGSRTLPIVFILFLPILIGGCRTARSRTVAAQRFNVSYKLDELFFRYLPFESRHNRLITFNNLTTRI